MTIKQNKNLPILLIEDDQALARLISDELEAEGWNLEVHHQVQLAVCVRQYRLYRRGPMTF